MNNKNHGTEKKQLIGYMQMMKQYSLSI